MGFLIKVWRWCLVRNIVIHAEHIPGRENVRADWGVWTILDGPLCITDKPSGRNLLQLEARSNSMGSGCTINPMERVQPVYVFPTEGGDGLSTTNRTSMAEPGLVPTVIEVIGGPSSPSTPYPGHTHKSSRAESSSGRTDSLCSWNWQEERNPLFIAVRKPYTTQLNQQQ